MAELCRGESGETLFRALENLAHADGAKPDGDDPVLFAAYTHLETTVHQLTTSKCDEGDAWPDRIRSGFVALLEAIAERPALAIVVIRHFPALHPATYRRYNAFLASFVPYMREGRLYAEPETELPTEVELLSLGAAEALIFAELEAGKGEQLPQLLPEILFSVLVPFLGPERAVAEMRRAAAS